MGADNDSKGMEILIERLKIDSKRNHYSSVRNSCQILMKVTTSSYVTLVAEKKVYSRLGNVQNL